MATIIPPEGEVVTIDPPTNRPDLLSLLGNVARTYNLWHPIWITEKVRTGAAWIRNERTGNKNGKRNRRAEKWMDLGRAVHGPSIYPSPAECLAYQEEEGVQKSPTMDGIPMVRVSGLRTFNVSAPLQRKWGVVEHKSDHSWWIYANYRSEAESYVHGSLLYTTPQNF